MLSDKIPVNLFHLALKKRESRTVRSKESKILVPMGIYTTKFLPLITISKGNLNPVWPMIRNKTPIKRKMPPMKINRMPKSLNISKF